MIIVRQLPNGKISSQIMSSLLLEFNVIRKPIFICFRKLLPLLPQVLIPCASVVRRQYRVSGITLGEVCDDMAPTFVVVRADRWFAVLTFETEATDVPLPPMVRTYFTSGTLLLTFHGWGL